MIFKLSSTRLKDEQNRPFCFYHTSPKANIHRFLPLSHFGSAAAAQARGVHYEYQSIGRDEPILPHNKITNTLLDKLKAQQKLPELKTYVVRLCIKHPLRLPDLGSHSLEQFYHWFQKYSPKKQFLIPAEIQADFTPNAHGYKHALQHFIFMDPFCQKAEALKQELAGENLFITPKDSKVKTHLPAFLGPVVRQCQAPYALAEKVAQQRLIRFLEGEGYDAFVYRNEWEDKGTDSYIIFRPEQVFPLDEPQTEHCSPKAPNNILLNNIEKRFFEAQHLSAPTQRILLHQQKLKKNRQK